MFSVVMWDVMNEEGWSTFDNTQLLVDVRRAADSRARGIEDKIVRLEALIGSIGASVERTSMKDVYL